MGNIIQTVYKYADKMSWEETTDLNKFQSAFSNNVIMISLKNSIYTLEITDENAEPVYEYYTDQRLLQEIYQKAKIISSCPDGLENLIAQLENL